MIDDLTSGDAGNDVLNAMDRKLRGGLLQQLKRTDLQAGHVLVQAGHASNELWFPCGGAVAAVEVDTKDGQRTDVAFVGRDGMVSGFVTNGKPAYATIRVLFPGRFLCLATDNLEAEDPDAHRLQRHLALYTDYFVVQLLQSMACRTFHTVDQRLARLLLQQKARFGASYFPLTQSQMAQMLGLGRTFVNQAIGRLRKTGAVGSKRGNIAIANERVLADTSCSCSRQLEDFLIQAGNNEGKE